MASQPQFCTNIQCNYAADGRCVEGYSLSECPHLAPIVTHDIDKLEEAPVAKEIARMISLASGEALNKTSASALQRRLTSRGIGLVGPNNSGKTSLIASVYGLLQDGPVADILFAGSSTLIGFEKVCHDARATSRRGFPHTERTIVGADATFFHLDLRLTEGKIVSLFLGDRSGEDYLAAADDLARADDFYELRRADTVTLLVNGEHLSGTEYRHEAKAISPQIVDALIEGGAIRKGCRLAIVLTKNDAVLASGNANRVTREFEEIVKTVTERHALYLADVRPFVISASPKVTSEVERGEGVGDLLHYWCGFSHQATEIDGPNPVELVRMIDLIVTDAGQF